MEIQIDLIKKLCGNQSIDKDWIFSLDPQDTRTSIRNGSLTRQITQDVAAPHGLSRLVHHRSDGNPKVCGALGLWEKMRPKTSRNFLCCFQSAAGD